MRFIVAGSRGELIAILPSDDRWVIEVATWLSNPNKVPKSVVIEVSKPPLPLWKPDSDDEGGVRKQGGDVAAQAIAAAQAAAALAAARATSNAQQQVPATTAGSLLPLPVAPNQQHTEATQRALDAAYNLQKNP